MKIRELENIQKDLQNAKMALIKQQEKVLDLQLEENKMLLDDAMKLSPKAKRIKTRIDEAFFDGWQNKDVVMWCKKTEYAKEFCRLMNEQGLKWHDETSYLKVKMWYIHKEKTAYGFNNGNYCSKEYYENKGYIILDFEDYIIKEEKEGMSKEELVKFLVDNFIDEDGDLDLSGLDFSNFYGDILINKMKVNGSLHQDFQKVGGTLFQGGQKVRGRLSEYY